MSIIDQVNHFEKYGMKIVPVVSGAKNPVTKDGKWKNVNWTKEDYEKASAGGVDHEASNIVDLDFDDYDAIKFQHLLPETLTVGKKENGRILATHLFYRFEGKKEKYQTFESRFKKDSIIIELLHNTQTVCIGNGRLIIKDVPPKKITQTEYNEIKRIIGKISLLAILTKYYPAEGQRDEFIMRVAGCLVRYTDWNTYERENFIEELCKANNDVEIKSRVSKVATQEEAKRLSKEFWGANGLADFINVEQKLCHHWFSFVNEKEIKDKTPITIISLNEFIHKEYPPVKYLINPLVATEQLIQIWSAPGVGKTWFSLELACSLANGTKFLKYEKAEKHEPHPILYVDGEMRASDLKDRFFHIIARYHELKQDFNFDLIKIAPCIEQPNQFFEPLNLFSGQQKLEAQAEEIFKKYNKKPIIFLDNISCLTNMQEKDGLAWNDFMQWLIKLRARGYTVIFLHHSTKEGSTSSGSNVKERSVDLEIKLSRPEEEEEIENHTGAQMKVEFKKWREFMFTDYSKSFIATLDRDSAVWKVHKIIKRGKNYKKLKYWLDKGVTTWSEEVGEHEDYGLPKASFYKELKKMNQDNSKNVKEMRNNS
jgi:putative DNA primase/helicase